MKIVVAEEDQELRDRLAQALRDAGHELELVENGRQAFFRATAAHLDLLIANVRLPEWDGFKCLEALAAVCPTLPVILWTTMAREEVLARVPAGCERNLSAVVSKGDSLDAVLKAVESVRPRPQMRTQKMARIVCTLGPSSNDVETIGRMILGGMNVARLNFSHGNHEEKSATLAAIRAAEEKWGHPVGVLQDLCGPKIRVGEMANGAIELVPGARLTVQAETVVGTPDRISLGLPGILEDLREGDPVLLDDGALELEVEAVRPGEAVCRVVHGGRLKSHKGMNLPATPLQVPSLTEKDRQDLEWGVANKVDYVALSFVRQAAEVNELRGLLRERGCDALVVAKVEKPEAVENIDAIVDAADAVMIARGDMGVELPAARVPWIQRDIIRRCRERVRPVITATQMLESMTQAMRPTRAEVSDVALAIYEGSDAVMLSGETAAGVDPVNVVKTMAAIVREAEAHLASEHRSLQASAGTSSGEDALYLAAATAAAEATLVVDEEGSRVLALARFDRCKPTIFVTSAERSARRASLWHSVKPIVLEQTGTFDAVGVQAMERAVQLGILKPGDLVAVVEHGDNPGTEFVEEQSLHFVRVHR